VANDPDLRAALAAERARTAGLLVDLARDFAAIAEQVDGNATDDEHDPEGATLGFERAQVSALLRRTRDRLAELDRALAAPAGPGGGAAGTVACERCGEPIPAARLLARPGATCCVTCADAARR
jgi:RNA polymerase-binding transcription factor DksA